MNETWLLRECPRCGFMLLRSEFPVASREDWRRRFCRECQGPVLLGHRLLLSLADNRLLTVGAAALLRMGCSAAATLILERRPAVWPSVGQARRLQRRVAA